MAERSIDQEQRERIVQEFAGLSRELTVEKFEFAAEKLKLDRRAWLMLPDCKSSDNAEVRSAIENYLYTYFSIFAMGQASIKTDSRNIDIVNLCADERRGGRVGEAEKLIDSGNWCDANPALGNIGTEELQSLLERATEIAAYARERFKEFRKGMPEDVLWLDLSDFVEDKIGEVHRGLQNEVRRLLARHTEIWENKGE